MQNGIHLSLRLLLKIFLLSIILFVFNITSLSAQTRVSKGLSLIEEDRINGVITDEEALVQKFYYGFNKSQLAGKYFFENDAPGKCATGIFMEFNKTKELLSKNSVAKIENCIAPLRKKAFMESTYISPSGKFELTYSIQGSNAVSSEDLDNSGIPDFVERIANYFDYSWAFVVDTLGYLAPPIGDGKYQIIFENSGYYGYTDIVNERLTYISMSNTFDGFSVNDDPEGDAIGAAKVTAIHEFMHACQIVYNNWDEDGWFDEAHATWVEDVGYDYVNDYYFYLDYSNITVPNRALTDSDGYSDCIFLHCLSQKFGVQITREIWERIGTYSWEEGLNSINAILQNYNSSLEQILPEYFSWCYLTGDNADNRLPSFDEAINYPTSLVMEEVSTFPYTIETTQDKLSACFYRYSINESSGNLSVSFNSEYYTNNFLLITYFKDTSVDIIYYTSIYVELIDTQNKLKNIDRFIIIPINSEIYETSALTLSVNKYREVIFEHLPLASSEDTSPKTISTNIHLNNHYINYDSLKLNYRFGNGKFQSLTLAKTNSFNNYSAVITNINDGDTISYYFSYYDSLRNFNNTLPLNAPDSLFSFMCGVDNIPPTLSHTPLTSLTKFDFPRSLFAEISDNYKVASAYVEYIVNDGDLKKLDFINLKDSLYYAPLFLDTNTNDNISYRIIVNDSANSNNTTTYPVNNEYVNFKINKGYMYNFDGNISHDYWNNIYSDTITIDDDFSILDANISFNISNLNYGDSLLIILTPPNGDQIVLNNKTPFASNSIAIIFDDDADLELFNNEYLVINNFIMGHFKPEAQNLNNLIGISSKGEWIITIFNNTYYSRYQFNNWGIIIQSDDTISDIEELNDNIIAIEYSLNQNYPNPFNPATTISYSLSQKGLVKLSIYDLLGREVRTLVNEEQNAGLYNISFNALDLASGIYLYSISCGDFLETKKMILLK